MSERVRLARRLAMSRTHRRGHFPFCDLLGWSRKGKCCTEAEEAEDERGNMPDERTALTQAIDRGLEEADLLYRCANLRIVEWAVGDARELARRIRLDMRVRLILGGSGRRLWWMATFHHQGRGYTVGRLRATPARFSSRRSNGEHPAVFALAKVTPALRATSQMPELQLPPASSL